MSSPGRLRKICSAVAALAVYCASALPARALIEPFDPAYIISDEEFADSAAMSCADVQAFLEQRKGILKGYIDEGKTAATHVCEQAAAFGINPRLLLVMTQKEMALLTDPAPDEKQIAWAAGCGPGWNSTRGFATQMTCAARTLRRNFDRAADGAPIDGVIPANRATLALYRYTTHVSGNRNLWKIWTGWWSGTQAPAPAPAPTAPVVADVVIDSRAVALTPALRANTAPCKLGWTNTPQGGSGHAWLTPNVARTVESTNFALWRPVIPAAGRYAVAAFVPARSGKPAWPCGGIAATHDTSSAIYVVQHRNGVTQVTIDQAPLNNVWAELGVFEFDAGANGYVALSDLTGEPSNTRWISIDEMRFIPVP